jgi:hypothetical protein
MGTRVVTKWLGFAYVVGGGRMIDIVYSAVCKPQWSGASAKNLSRACVFVH